MDGIYHINKPYPPVFGLAENRRVGKLLLKSYCGHCSEMTAVNQYMYHYMSSLGEYIPVSEALRAIAAVEQQHLYMLGCLIKQLGVNPKLRTFGESGPKYWRAKHITYGDSVKEMLLADIACEQDAIRQYEYARSCIGNTQIKALLSRIVEDETLHARIFADLYNRYF